MSSFTWPPDLEARIVGLALAKDANIIVQEMKILLQPHKGGSTQNAFFSANPGVEKSWSKIRQSNLPLPELMKPFYEAYDPTIEFRAGNLTFFSESQMQKTSVAGSVDLAYEYMGMGHILVHTYIRSRDVIVSYPDGGANGFERAVNADRRREMLEQVIPEPDIQNENVRTFVDWWKSRHSSESEQPVEHSFHQS